MHGPVNVKYMYVAFYGKLLVTSIVFYTFYCILTGSLTLISAPMCGRIFFIPIALKIEGYWIIFIHSVLLILSHCDMQKGYDDASVESTEIVISLAFGQQIVTEYDIFSHLML